VKEIRVHGRGGQGSVTAAELLAVAAFYDGRFSQAFPAFGVERRGAPVMAFVRLDDRPIRIRSQIYEPDHVIVQDPTLVEVVDVAGSARETILINTEKSPDDFDLDTHARVETIDATRVALDVIGRPIVNTIMLGAFSALTGEVKLESIERAVRERFPGPVGEKNAEAVRVVYKLMESKK